MKYGYEGYDRRAKKVSGTLEASNTSEAAEQLRGQNIRPTHLKLLSGGGGAQSKSPSVNSHNIRPEFSFEDIFANPKPSIQEFSIFIRQLATMQGAGIPLVQALNILSETVENKAFAKIIRAVQAHVEGGVSFSEALRKFPHVFDDIFINLAAAGEVSGALEEIFNRLSVYYEKTSSLKRKITSAMYYPAFTLVAVFCVVAVMLVYVVPSFEGMFKQSKVDLNPWTQFIIDTSHFIQDNLIMVSSALGAAVLGLYYLLKSKEFLRTLDPYLLRVPVFGPLLLKSAVARFARTLSTMIQAGVPFLECLNITASVAGNTVIESAILAARESISEGNNISKPLAKSGVFPKMVIGMVSVGEQTGALEKMLIKVAEFYEDEVDNSVTSLTSILEPLMIVVVGLVVAGILIPLYLPIFKLGDVVGG